MGSVSCLPNAKHAFKLVNNKFPWKKPLLIHNNAILEDPNVFARIALKAQNLILRVESVYAQNSSWYRRTNTKTGIQDRCFSMNTSHLCIYGVLTPYYDYVG